MGGNIWLTTNENEGTTVYFYLDYDMSVFNESQTILHQTEIDIIKQKSILIIDEDIGNQKHIIQKLEKYSIKAKTMPNYQFYNKFGESNKKFDLIFFDYNSGFEEFLKENRLKLLGDNTFLIIMTTTNLEEKIINELKGFRFTIIYKPIKLQEMITSLIEYSK
jgi:DNA-binding NtrC family response regulator